MCYFEVATEYKPYCRKSPRGAKKAENYLNSSICYNPEEQNEETGVINEEG